MTSFFYMIAFFNILEYMMVLVYVYICYVAIAIFLFVGSIMSYDNIFLINWQIK